MNWDKISDLMTQHRRVSKKMALELLAGLQSEGLHVVEEDHLIEITGQIPEHPEGFEASCACSLCCSYD